MNHTVSFPVACALSLALSCACAFAGEEAPAAPSADEAPALSPLDEEYGALSGELLELQMNLRDKQAAVERMLANPKSESDEAKAIRKRISELKTELAKAEAALRDENAKDPEAKALLDEIEADKAAIDKKGRRHAELKKLRAEAAKAEKPNKPVSKTSHTPPAE